MTTDDKTTDPTPALLPPERLAAARSALDAFEDAPMGSTLQDDAAYDAARMLAALMKCAYKAVKP